MVLDVVREGTEMGAWRPVWLCASARATLRLMKNNLWCSPDACSPSHFSEITLTGIIPFGAWPSERGKLNRFVCCFYSSNSYRNSICVGGGKSSNRSKDTCSNKTMKEK